MSGLSEQFIASLRLGGSALENERPDVASDISCERSQLLLVPASCVETTTTAGDALQQPQERPAMQEP